MNLENEKRQKLIGNLENKKKYEENHIEINDSMEE